MKFEHRPSFGRSLFYPMDDDALQLSSIFRCNGHGVRSMTEAQLRVLSHFGVVIQITGQTLPDINASI